MPRKHGKRSQQSTNTLTSTPNVRGPLSDKQTPAGARPTMMSVSRRQSRSHEFRSKRTILDPGPYPHFFPYSNIREPIQNWYSHHCQCARKLNYFLNIHTKSVFLTFCARQCKVAFWDHAKITFAYARLWVLREMRVGPGIKGPRSGGLSLRKN